MLSPIIYDFLKGKSHPIGHISERKDGTWKKIGPGAKDWVLVKRKAKKQTKKKTAKKKKGLSKLVEAIDGLHERTKPKNRRDHRQSRKLSKRHGAGRGRSSGISQARKLRGTGTQGTHVRELAVGSGHSGERSGTRQTSSVKAPAKLQDIPLRRTKTGDFTQATREQINQRVIALLDSKRKPSEYSEAEKSLMRLYSGSGGTKESESTAGLTEFYTPYKIADKMWEIARALGLKKGGSVLEPSAGIGRLSEGDKAKRYKITQLEQNKISAKINSILNPHTEVINKPFETLFMGGKLGNEPKAYDGPKHDLVIGNPPYGDYISRYKGMGEGKEHSRWEDYFIERGLDTLKDGGHMIMLIPSSFLSKAKDKIREKIAGKAKLIDAYRLPRGIFAGSGIGTDIVVLKKDKGGSADSLSRDNFFAKYPENVLGEVKTRKRFGKTITEVHGPFSNVERIGHRLSEAAKQKISEALQGNKNAEGTRRVSIKKPIKPKIVSRKVRMIGYSGGKAIWEREDGSQFYADGGKTVELKEETKSEQKPTLRVVKQKKSAKPKKAKGIVEQMLYDYDFGEDKGTHDFHSFKKKYGSQFSEHDLAMWSAVQADGSLDMQGLSFRPDTMSITHGKTVPDVLYASGSIYSKLEQLEREKTELKLQQYAKQKKLLTDALPAKKAAKDIQFSPLSSFVRDFWTDEEARDSEDDDSENKLLNDFTRWVKRSVSYDELSGSSADDIIDYVLQKPVKKKGDTKKAEEEANHRRSKRRQVAEKLFNDYIREGLDASTREELVKEYNQVYNSSVRPDYKKIPVFLDGLSKTFKTKDLELKPHQLEGLAYLGSSGKGIVAYDVGLGKTMLGICGVMQAVQRGWSKRPAVVVPKAVLQNWVREFKDLFPDTDINVLGNLGKQYVKDPDDIKIKDGAVNFLTYEGMKRIGYKNETLHDLTKDVQDVMEAGGVSSIELTKRERQKRREKAEEFAGKAQRGAQFLMEDLGFDHITIDEAHNMKNVFTRAGDKKKGAVQHPEKEKGKGKKKKTKPRKANEFRFITGNSSDRGVKAFLHSQYIQKNNGDRNVTLLTATPFTNSPIEIYSMLSHVARDELRAKRLFNMNDFMAHFVDLKQEYVIKGNGKVVIQDVAKGFKNLKELQEIVKNAIDFKTGAEVKIKRPNKKESLVELPLTDKQSGIIAQAEIEYSEGVAGSKDKERKAKRLIAIEKQRKAALSPKLVTGKGHFVKDSPKLKYTFDSVAKVHKERPEVGQVVYLPRGIDYYPETTQYLEEAHGIDPRSVAFMTSKVSDTKKQEIMDEFNDPKGKIKIVVGSETIKEGVNLQSNTAALYNTFLGWNPTELEQLRGRIWRYGNKQKNVHVVYPVSVDSIDSVMYQKHDEKSKRIGEIWKFKGDYVDVSPIDPFEAKYHIIKDPHKRAHFKIMMDTDSLKAELSDSQAVSARIKRIQDSLESSKNSTEAYKKSMKEWQDELLEDKKNLQEVEKNLKNAVQKKDKALIDELKEEKESAEYTLGKTQQRVKYYEKIYKNAVNQIETSQQELKSMGIQSTADAQQKMDDLQKENNKIETKISSIEDNKDKYIEQARKEIAAMQKPISSVEESTKNMVNQVLSSIRETDRAVKKEQQQERFAASLFPGSFLKSRNRLIIENFLSRAS